MRFFPLIIGGSVVKAFVVGRGSPLGCAHFVSPNNYAAGMTSLRVGVAAVHANSGLRFEVHVGPPFRDNASANFRSIVPSFRSE